MMLMNIRQRAALFTARPDSRSTVKIGIETRMLWALPSPSHATNLEHPIYFTFAFR